MRSTFDAYRAAREGPDRAALLELYAPDAVLIRYNARTPPAAPGRIEGRDAIERLWRRVPADLVHRLSDEVIGEDGFAFVLTCTYPNGQQVVGTYICDVAEGRVTRELSVEAWDR